MQRDFPSQPRQSVQVIKVSTKVALKLGEVWLVLKFLMCNKCCLELEMQSSVFTHNSFILICCRVQAAQSTIFAGNFGLTFRSFLQILHNPSKERLNFLVVAADKSCTLLCQPRLFFVPNIAIGRGEKAAWDYFHRDLTVPSVRRRT